MAGFLLLASHLLLALPIHAVGTVKPPPQPNHEFNDPIISPSFDAFIKSTIKTSNSPGLAIAFISGNQTWARGYGHASLKTNTSSSPPVPITPRTLFSAGSTTKSHTAAALSLLVSSPSNNLTWTTPVSQILVPEIFSLSNQWSTSHITLADILSHRTGYPGYPLGVQGKSVNKTLHRLRYLIPSAEPRTKYQYSNEMYAAAGAVVSTVSGMPLGQFFKEKLWTPMGMSSSMFRPEGGKDVHIKGLASEYFWNNDTGKFEGPLPRVDTRGAAGAGGVVSNVVDYMAYLRGMMGMLPAQGQVLGEKERYALLGTHMFLSERALNEDGAFFTGPSWYGFGWMGDYVLGELGWHHSGGAGQMRTEMVFFPRLKKGFAIMQNSVSPAMDVVLYSALYEMLGTPVEEQLPWTDIVKQQSAQAAAAVARCPLGMYPEEFGGPALPQTGPSWSLEAHAGRYSNPGFVDITLSLECNSTSRVSAPGSPAHTTRDGKGCFLRTDVLNTGNGDLAIELEHVNGNKWVGWIYMVDVKSYLRPFVCIKAVFEGQGNRVTQGNFLLRSDTTTSLESFDKIA